MNGRVRNALRHPVTVNAAALYAGQFAISVLPLVVLPYLARALGPAQLGMVVFVQYFSFLLGSVLEFGFGFSATREVARVRDDPTALAATVAGVVGAKALLSGACAALALVCWPLVPIFRDAPELLALGVALTFGQGLAPAWFYAGMEWLVFPTAVEFLARASAAVGVILLVDGPEDTALVLGIYAATTAASTVLTHCLMYRRVSLRRPTTRGALRTLRHGSTLFVSTASVTMYNTVGVVLLGSIVPAAQVGFFSGAEKVVRAAQRVLASAGEAVYPRVTFLLSTGRTQRANTLAALGVGGLAAVATVAALVLVVLAEPLVHLLYGPQFDASVPLLRILGATLPLAILASSASTLWLLPRGLDRTVTRIVVLAGLLDVALIAVATPVFGVQAAAWALVAVESFALAGMVLAARRAGALSLRASWA